MGPKRFSRQNFSLFFVVKFKKLGFSAPLSENNEDLIFLMKNNLPVLKNDSKRFHSF